MSSSAPSGPEVRAMEQVERLTDPALLRTVLLNARGKSVPVENAAFERLISVCAGSEGEEAVARDLWKMVFAVEEIRRLMGRKVWRMNRLRPVIAEKGALAALEACVLRQTEGFGEILGYGRPDHLAEAIVLRHSARYAASVLQSARERLVHAEVNVEAAVDR